MANNLIFSVFLFAFKEGENAQAEVNVEATAATVPGKLKSIFRTPAVNAITAGVSAVNISKTPVPVKFDDPILLDSGECPDPASMLEDEASKKPKDSKKKTKKSEKM